MKEEAAALVNKGVAHLVPLPTTLAPPSEEVVRQRTEARVARFRKLADRMAADEEKKAKAAKEKYAVVGEAAKAKREARVRKRAEAARVAAVAAGEDPAVAQAAFDAAVASVSVEETKAKAEAVKERPIPTAENSNLFTIVPSTPVHPDLQPTSTVGMGSEEFPFPSSVRDKALVGTFAALQSRGLRMGLGPRFGGEWLVYPGDYLRYHAHFTSQVIVKDEPILPAQLVAWGRLGTGTKKAGLLCCWDDEAEEEVEFYSLEWSNFG